jgi:hypothetical protein
MQSRNDRSSIAEVLVGLLPVEDRTPGFVIAGCFVRFGADIETVLRLLPATGPIFPYLGTVSVGDRATEFKQRCQGLGIEGVTLHSYRYAWAERARKSGYPERFTQESLSHNSKDVHHVCALCTEVTLLAPEEYDRKATSRRVFPMDSLETLSQQRLQQSATRER